MANINGPALFICIFFFVVFCLSSSFLNLKSGSVNYVFFFSDHQPSTNIAEPNSMYNAFLIKQLYIYVYTHTHTHTIYILCPVFKFKVINYSKLIYNELWSRYFASFLNWKNIFVSVCLLLMGDTWINKWTWTPTWLLNNDTCAVRTYYIYIYIYNCIY